ncbi:MULTISPECIES: hypothetical protein [unclassified Mesorhizobium]|uniref:hypothetical protein n=1 Tax=unclassified Mesorhizobium TaxID=325217 RepID=UPI00117D7D53|nr:MULTISPECIES: hypothetical protein [unclassified Mesorhizobium]
MAGFSPRHIQRAPGGAAPTKVGDGCDLEFRLDLVGIRTEVTSWLTGGEILTVRLVENATARSVVCSNSTGDVAGTLAAFRGLSQLIGCMATGAVYIAVVEQSSATRCAVQVIRR